MKKLIFLALLTITARGSFAQDDDNGTLNNPGWETSFTLSGDLENTANGSGSGGGSTGPQGYAAIAEDITPEIRQLAANLNNDPLRIYNYVHDQIRYVPYFGSLKGAQLTLLEKSGNDFDQCALLVALLRAANYTGMGYQFGFMLLPYSRPDNVDAQHWLNLSLPNTNWNVTSNYLSSLLGTRGYAISYLVGDTNTVGFQRVWVTLPLNGITNYLDPSFKIVTASTGIDLTIGMGFTNTALLSAAQGTATSYSVSGLNETAIRSALQNSTSNLLAYISNNVPNATVSDIMGGAAIVPSGLESLPTSLPFTNFYITSSYPLLSWTNIPTNFMSAITISLPATNISFWTPQLEAKCIALTFGPTGTATLLLDNATQMQTVVTGPSGQTTIILKATHPYQGWDTSQNVPVDTGKYDQSVTNSYQRTNSSYAIVYAFNASSDLLKFRQQKLNAYRTLGFADTSTQATTETLNVMGLNWLAQTEGIAEMVSQQAGQLCHFHHRFGRAGFETSRGYYIDVPLQNMSNVPKIAFDPASNSAFQPFDIVMYFCSAMEHGMIEQLQSSNRVAASTIKMLEIASANSQAIYLAASTNWTVGANPIRPKLIGYDSTTLTNIQNALSQGCSVLLPSAATNRIAGAGSWSGAAYVQIGQNGSSRTANMLIGGGYNGGYVDFGSAQPDVPFVSHSAVVQPNFYVPGSAFTFMTTAGDPVAMADGSFQLSATDLSLEGAEPRGFNFSRYYSSDLRNTTNASLSAGWIHNYFFNITPVSATQPLLGDTTPQQAAPILAATAAALKVYDNNNYTPKNWVVTALITKWAIDQTINNAVSIQMGKDTVQFTKQPDGSFTAPGNCTMTLTKNGSGYNLLQRHGNTFKFDNNNRLTNIVDQYSRSMKFTYNGSGQLSTIADWTNRSLSFTYTNTPSRLAMVADSTGRAVYYNYSTNSSGQLDLASAVDTEGQTTSYLYDGDHDIIATLDPIRNTVISNIYDSLGHVTTQYTAGEPNKMWRIVSGGGQTTVVDPAGGVQNYFFDAKSRQIAFQDAVGNLSQTFYDGQDHVVMTVSPLNETNQSIYDANNNLIATIDPLGFSKQFIYDSQNSLKAMVDPRGNTNQFGYNAQFSLTGSTNGAGDFATYSYNSDGTLASKTDSGGTTSYNYNTNGYISEITYPGSLGSEGFMHDVVGNVIRHTNALAFVTTNQFNTRRQLTNSMASNVVTKVTYDNVGNLISTTDARGFVTSNTWSATRHLLSTIMPATPAGTAVVSNAFDNRDWLESTRSALGKSTFYTNDAAQRLVGTTDPLGRINKIGYDGDGRQIASTNGAGEVTRQQYNLRGQPTNLIDAALETVGKAYDAAGNQTYLTNRLSKLWQFQFDAANRLTNTISPKGFSTSVTFNHQGLVSSTKDAKSQTNSLYYDPKGRLTNRTDSLAATTYIYDPADHVTNISETINSQPYSLKSTYDAYGRMSSFTDALGNSIQYRYDASGNLTNLIYPGNRVVSYAYDSLNRLTNVTDWSNRKTSFTFDLGGRMTQLSRPNNTFRTISYNDDGEVTNIIEQTTAGMPIALWRFAYNSNATVQWEFGAPMPPTNALPSRTSTFDEDNRLLTVNGSNVTNDNNGNMVWGPGTNSTLAAYAFDPRNRLTSFGGVTNAYDPSGNRIGLLYGTNVVSFVINPNASLPQVLMRIRAGTTNCYIYGAGLLYEITETAASTNTLYYHFDRRGGTVGLTDGSGNVTGRVQYSAYATTISRTANFPDTPFLYNGRYGVQTDPNGLLYMSARFYNPYICRFINADPSGFSGGLNFYAFAAGNPISLADPFGLTPTLLDRVWSWVDSMVNPYSGGSPSGGQIAHAAIDNTVSSFVGPSAPDYIQRPMAYNFNSYDPLGSAPQWAAIGMAAASVVLGLPEDSPTSVTAEVQSPVSRTITVLGAGRDVSPYIGKPGFNTFTGEGVAAAELDTQNALWLNNAIQRGDQIWLVTDPTAHQALMNQLNKNSAYLYLELPMLNEYSGVSTVPKFTPQLPAVAH